MLLFSDEILDCKSNPFGTRRNQNEIKYEYVYEYCKIVIKISSSCFRVALQ